MPSSPSSTTLLFQAPPSPTSPPDDGHGRGRGTTPAGSSGLRMLKGARRAATGMNVSEAHIRAVLEDPQEVQPDAKRSDRTRLRRNGLVVTTGNDGMILRVARRG
ncbi:MAG: hypothetical protein ACRDV2_07820 [Actinomycetes bacterium]